MILSLNRSPQFRKEVEGWLEEGLITEDQAHALYKKYALDEEAPWYRRSGFILKGVALILAGMGMLLLISQNWDKFSDVVRMLFGLIPLVTAWGIGFYFHYKKNNTDAASLAFFFGSIMLGVSIFIQAQIFQLSGHPSDLVMWWLIGSLPIVFLFNSGVQQSLVQVLFGIWVIMCMNDYEFAWASPVLLAAIVYLVWKKPNPLNLIFLLVNAGILILHINDALHDHYELEDDFTLMMASSLLLLSTTLPFFRNQYSQNFLETLYRVFNTAFTWGFFILTFEDPMEGFLDHDPSIVAYVLVIPAAIMFSLHPRNIYGWMILAISGAVMGLHAFGLLDWDEGVALLIANALFLGLSVFRIAYGLKNREKKHFIIGIFMLMVMALARYVGYIENYTITALLFIACAIGIFLLNRFWNKRYETE